jgi:hypothetical protein
MRNEISLGGFDTISYGLRAILQKSQESQEPDGFIAKASFMTITPHSIQMYAFLDG